MAPEQCRGEFCDARTDIYAAGILFYRMLAGRLPFQRENALAMLGATLTQPIPPLSRFAPQVDPFLESIVMKAVARAPEDRFASVAEFTKALNGGSPASVSQLTSRSSPSLSLPPPSSSKSLPFWVWTAAAVAIGISVGHGAHGYVQEARATEERETGLASLQEVLGEGNFGLVERRMVKHTDLYDMVEPNRINPLVEETFRQRRAYRAPPSHHDPLYALVPSVWRGILSEQGQRRRFILRIQQVGPVFFEGEIDWTDDMAKTRITGIHLGGQLALMQRELLSGNRTLYSEIGEAVSAYIGQGQMSGWFSESKSAFQAVPLRSNAI